MRGRFGPCVFTGDAEHRRDGVIAKRHQRLLVLPAGTRNVHEARLGMVGHRSHLGDLSEGIRRIANSSGKVLPSVPADYTLPLMSCKPPLDGRNGGDDG